MKRFKRMVLLTAASMMLLTPATIALADGGGFSNSVQVYGYGYSSGAHYTNYSERYQATYTSTYVEGYGLNSAITAGPMQTAASKVTGPENAYHTHYYSAVVGYNLH